MSERVLFRVLVSQSARLIARIITLTNARPNLAHLQEDFFYELSVHLQNYGVPRRVAADMFGLAMRSYLRRIKKYNDELSDREHQLSLWQIVYSKISESPDIQRQKLLDSFSFSHRDSVCSVLKHLCEAGLVTEHRRDGVISYSARERDANELDVDEVAQYLWVMIFVHDESSFPHEQLLDEAIPLFGEQMVSAGLDLLIDDGCVDKLLHDGTCSYSTVRSNPEQPFGWLVAISIHLDSVFEAVITKLTMMQSEADLDADVRGGTWTFKLRGDHPFKDRVSHLFDGYQKNVKELFASVHQYNESHPDHDDSDEYQVDFYMGQGVRYLDPSSRDS